MSRDFSKNTSNYMSLGVNTVGPLINGASAATVAAWVRADSFTSALGANLIVFGLGTNLHLGLSIHDGTNPVIAVRARSTDGDTLQVRTGTTSLSTGTWALVGAEINYAAGTITPRFNGVAEGGGAVTFGSATYTNSAAANPDGVGTSAVPPGTSANQWDGLIAHLCIWRAALTNGEWTSLAAGANPGAIQTADLVSYHRFAGSSSPEPNEVAGGPSGTITGSVPAGASDPGVWAPWRVY